MRCNAWWLPLAGGILAALALPPVGAVPLLLPGLWLSFRQWRQAASWKQAFAAVWLFAFGLYAVSLYWISNALMVDAQTFAWLVPFAVVLIPAYLALFPAAALAALHVRRPASQALAALAFAAAWTLMEWTRSHYGMPFPWALTGSIWQRVPPVGQALSLTGVYGLGFLTMALGLAVCGPSWRARAAALGLVALSFAWGWQRMRQPVVDTPYQARIVQPNIAQEMKWEEQKAALHWKILLRLSDIGGKSTPPLVIWPESASPYPLAVLPDARRQATANLKPGQYLITGSNRHIYGPHGDLRTVYNSALALTIGGRLADFYDKRFQVPFGEYVPLRNVLPLPPVAHMGIDFGRGANARTIALGDYPTFSPLICYESTFAGQVTDQRDRPDWLLNITNDAWFGDSAGAYQHLALARMRAIEEGLPMLRAANTGVSAVIDVHGRLRRSLPLGRRGVIDTAIPGRLETTLYGRTGDTPALAVMLLILVAALFNSRRTAPARD